MILIEIESKRWIPQQLVHRIGNVQYWPWQIIRCRLPKEIALTVGKGRCRDPTMLQRKLVKKAASFDNHERTRCVDRFRTFDKKKNQLLQLQESFRIPGVAHINQMDPELIFDPTTPVSSPKYQTTARSPVRDKTSTIQTTPNCLFKTTSFLKEYD